MDEFIRALSNELVSVSSNNTLRIVDLRLVHISGPACKNNNSLYDPNSKL